MYCFILKSLELVIKGDQAAGKHTCRLSDLEWVGPPNNKPVLLAEFLEDDVIIVASLCWDTPESINDRMLIATWQSSPKGNNKILYVFSKNISHSDFLQDAKNFRKKMWLQIQVKNPNISRRENSKWRGAPGPPTPCSITGTSSARKSSLNHCNLKATTKEVMNNRAYFDVR